MATRLTRRALIASAPGLYLASKGAGRAYAQEKTVKVGVIQPMSGNLSPYSQEGQPALEYIVKKINTEGGIKSMGGAKIQLVIADDASQPVRTASEARRRRRRSTATPTVTTTVRRWPVLRPLSRQPTATAATRRATSRTQIP